jgi:hypothetical protein
MCGVDFQEFRAWRVFCGGEKGKTMCARVQSWFLWKFCVFEDKNMCVFGKICMCENFNEASCCKRGVARFWVVVERV